MLLQGSRLLNLNSSSYNSSRNQPLRFPCGHVLRGAEKSLVLSRESIQWTLRNHLTATIHPGQDHVNEERIDGTETLLQVEVAIEVKIMAVVALGLQEVIDRHIIGIAEGTTEIHEIEIETDIVIGDSKQQSLKST
jgi:hypothetical protein